MPETDSGTWTPKEAWQSMRFGPMSKFMLDETGQWKDPQDVRDTLMQALDSSVRGLFDKGWTPGQAAPSAVNWVEECPDFDMSEVDINRHISATFRDYLDEKNFSRSGVSDPCLARPDLDRDLRDMERDMEYRAERRFHFGMRELDGAIGEGIAPGEMFSLLGNPGSMKTSLLLRGFDRWIRDGWDGILFFSLDMDKSEIWKRLLMAELSCGEYALERLREAGADEYREAKHALYNRYKGKIDVRENTAKHRWSIDDVRRMIEFNAPKLVAIDYVTLLKPSGKESDYEVANVVASTMKELAKSYGISIVLISQMSMESRRIQASGGTGGSAKGGGIINELSNTEIELFRDASTDSYDTSPKIIATITKTRRGIAGQSYQLDYKGPSMTFTGIANRVQRATRRKPLFDTL